MRWRCRRRHERFDPWCRLQHLHCATIECIFLSLTRRICSCKLKRNRKVRVWYFFPWKSSRASNTFSSRINRRTTRLLDELNKHILRVSFKKTKRCIQKRQQNVCVGKKPRDGFHPCTRGMISFRTCLKKEEEEEEASRTSLTWYDVPFLYVIHGEMLRRHGTFRSKLRNKTREGFVGTCEIETGNERYRYLSWKCLSETQRQW